MSKNISLSTTDIFRLYPCKVICTPEGCRFTVNSGNFPKNSKLGVAVYDKTNGSLAFKHMFTENERIGNVYSAIISDFDPNSHSYSYICNDKYYTDERAEGFTDKLSFGDFDPSKALKACVIPEFDWKDDKKPTVSYEDMFLYLLHVRGFTMDPSSGVKHKGTFKGLSEKKDYLKKLGVTSIELQPAYEFNENDKKTGRYNYWGYCQGLYYTPKSAYSESTDAATEFANMVNAFHKDGMEIIMQMYFPEDFPKREIPFILEYWAVKYHIDGFHVLGSNIPMDIIDDSPILSDVKIFTDNLWGVNMPQTDYYDSKPVTKRYGLFRDEYMYALRRFIKGDSGVLADVVSKLRNNPKDYAVINYLDSYNTFTLADCFAYDHKHNENNGEDNRDGCDYNCTWNCGEEGPTNKPKVNALRRKQMKNALILLFLSSGVPMIFMGDEMGNTQMGNNNAYCHDDEVTHLDWKGLKRKNSNFDFISALAKIRREHTFYHDEKEMSMVDLEGCGFPELSYHGESAWMTSLDSYKNSIGIMVSEKGVLYYFAINMHWEKAVLSLPRAPKGCEWSIVNSTDDVEISKDDKITLTERTIALVVSKTKEVKEEKSK
jgi:glycogen operon protein